MNPSQKINHDISVLKRETQGSPSICIAVLDGPVDTHHPCFNGSKLIQFNDNAPPDHFSATSHGTHIASIIFGQHGSVVSGIAPRCRGLVIPIFTNDSNGKIRFCSQNYLAHAIELALANSANIITISGGQFVNFTEPEASPFLMKALQSCAKNNVLVIAAAGNDGCSCLHVPAALPNVLAVGAMSMSGLPMESSNWGHIYQQQGLLAPGQNILGADPGGGTSTKSGTSFSTPIVAGVAGLFMSLQHQQNGKIDADSIRLALLRSAQPCPKPKDIVSCQKYLVGSLNVMGARTMLFNQNVGRHKMLDTTNEQQQDMPIDSMSGAIKEEQQKVAIDGDPRSKFYIDQSNDLSTEMSIAGAQKSSAGAIHPSGDCETCGGQEGPHLVYALGELVLDFPTESRRDSFNQARGNKSLHEYISKNIHEAPSLHWVLTIDNTPIYVIQPVGPFAHITYQRLSEFLGDEAVERISVPGYSSNRRPIMLLSGETVPILVPEARGMYSWSTEALLSVVVPSKDDTMRNRVEDFLNRIYYDFRNLGKTPQERALNYSATNVCQAASVLKQASEEGRVLETISVEPSPLARSGADCYDVKLRFFDPENVMRAKRVFRFTVDVSDVIPVGIGNVRVWNEV